MTRRVAYLLIVVVAALVIGYLFRSNPPSQPGECDTMTSEACRRPAPTKA